jgi:hypothetical protein
VLAPFLHALLAPESPIFGGSGDFMELLDFSSSEGVQQGSVEGMLAFALAIARRLKQLDEELRAECGGMARAGADDVSAVGTPAALFPAVRRFSDAIDLELGLLLNAHKSFCWGPAHLALELDLHRGDIPLGSVTDAAGATHLGVKVFGVPIGSDGYVREILSCIGDRLAGTSARLISSLGQSHKQALWIITHYSTNHKLDYFARHCYPGDTLDLCMRGDALVRAQAEVALGVGSVDWDWLAAARLGLPQHMAGMGLRPLTPNRGAHFLGGAAWAVSTFLDVHGARPGVVSRRGALERPEIVARVGRNAFEDMAADGWRPYFASGSRLGCTVRALWSALRGGVPSHFDGPLIVLRTLAEQIPVARMQGKPSLQASITADLERVGLAAMIREMSLRPAADRQRWLFFNVTRESSLAFTAWRRAFSFVPDDEWVEIAARFLGLPSPCCAAIVGSPVQVARNRLARVQLVDRFGDALQASTCFTGDHFRPQHDAVVRTLVHFGRYYAGTVAVHEDSNVFGSVLRQCPQQRLPAAEDCRRAAVVDARIALPGTHGGRALVDYLLEQKCVHVSPSRYGGRSTRQAQAVARRAESIPGERLAQLQAVDRRLFGTAPGQVGPMEQRLNSFPPVLGTVTGAFGEWSESIVNLLKTFASMGADAWQARLGAPTVAASRSTLLWLMRSELGVCVARGNARLLLARARAVSAQRVRPGRAAGASSVDGAPRAALDAATDAQVAREAARGVPASCERPSAGSPSRRGHRGRAAG